MITITRHVRADIDSGWVELKLYGPNFEGYEEYAQLFDEEGNFKEKEADGIYVTVISEDKEVGNYYLVPFDKNILLMMGQSGPACEAKNILDGTSKWRLFKIKYPSSSSLFGL